MARAITLEAKDERRQSILVAALDEFYEKGFTSARMDDIAARTDISKAALYLYFKNKETLFLELIRELTSPKMASLFHVLDQAGSFRDGMLTMADFLPGIVRQSPMPKLLKVMVSEGRSFEGIARHYRENVIDKILAHIVEFLEHHRATGEIDFDDAEVTARLLIAPVVLNAVFRIVFGATSVSEDDLRLMFRTHAGYLIKALSTEGDAHGR